MDVNQLVRDWFNQHGNKKNADVKRLISVLESILSHDTVKNVAYLGIGVLALKVVLDSLNELYKTKCESDLDKLMLSPSTMIVENIEEFKSIEEEE